MVLERIARSLRLGRWRYFRGYDLDGNRYFELPHPNQPNATKRTIDYKIKRELSDYGYDTLPIQWNMWMRFTRKDPPTIQELEREVFRQQRLREDVAELDRAYAEEKAGVLAEAERVAQIDAPKRKQKERKEAPYPSHSNPSIVPESMKVGHPPSQEFGANVPKSVPDETTFPSIAQDTPERSQMAAALDEAADIKLGKSEKERQLRQRDSNVETAEKGKEATRWADAPATPNDSYKPEAWAPTSRRR